jgi:hypothetical protein
MEALEFEELVEPGERLFRNWVERKMSKSRKHARKISGRKIFKFQGVTGGVYD